MTAKRLCCIVPLALVAVLAGSAIAEGGVPFSMVVSSCDESVSVDGDLSTTSTVDGDTRTVSRSFRGRGFGLSTGMRYVCFQKKTEKTSDPEGLAFSYESTTVTTLIGAGKGGGRKLFTRKFWFSLDADGVFSYGSENTSTCK